MSDARQDAEFSKTNPSVDQTPADAGKQRSTPKGWWVNPPKEIKELIEQRCEESLRDPQQEIVWLLRDWWRKVHEPSLGKTDQPLKVVE